MNVREYIRVNASDARDAIRILQDEDRVKHQLNETVVRAGLSRLQNLINAIEHAKDLNEDIYSLLERATSKNQD